jgi:hypothetical protein
MSPLDSTPPLRCLPPDPERVLIRGLVLCHLGLRASLDLQAGHPRAHELHEELKEWATTHPIPSELEEHELARIMVPLGELRPADLLECTWEFEAAAVMGWALGLIALPTFDELASGDEVLAAFGTDDPQVMRAVLAELDLRPGEDLRAASARNRLVRVRLAEKHFAGDPPSDAWRAEAFHLGLPLIEGDLALDGRPVSEAPAHRLEECLLATGPRRRAIRWLLGRVMLYSETPRLGHLIGPQAALAAL